MSGIGETISANLARYFERKLLDGKEMKRAEPAGYRSDFHRASELCVLRHEASGAVICAQPLDLVERVDRRMSSQPARIVFCYPSPDAFRDAGELAHRNRHREAWRALVAAGCLSPTPSGASDVAEDAGGGELEWLGGGTALEPSQLHARVEKSEEPCPDPSFCLALFLPADCCRDASTPGAPRGALELCEPRLPGAGPEVEHGMSLVAAAGRGDAGAVARCLAARADPDSQDVRGWTALHAAARGRPCWEVLDQLLPRCDPSLKTLNGQLAVGVADEKGYLEVAEAIRERMRAHPKGKHQL